MRTSNVWFIALGFCFVVSVNGSSVNSYLYGKLRLKPSNRNAGKHATSESLGRNAESKNKPEGKFFFPWKRPQPQPQTNLILITRPTTFTTPTITTPTTNTISVITTPTTGNRIGQGYGQGNRRPALAAAPRPPQRRRRRRRPWNNGRLEEKTQQPEKLEREEQPAAHVVNNVQGVSAKLDMEQWGRSLVGMRFNEVKNPNDAGQPAVELLVEKGKGRPRRHRHRPLKPKIPQTTAILATTIPTTLSTTTTTNSKNNKSPKKQTQIAPTTYVTALMKDEYNNKENAQSNRQSIWQSLTQRWRERRKKPKDANNNNKTTTNLQQQQQQQQEQEEEDEWQMDIKDEDENENEDEHEIVIDEYGKIHIKRIHKQPDHMKNQKQEEEEQAMENASSLINENNTNSRLQNIINAFRLRTPTIYKRQR